MAKGEIRIDVRAKDSATRILAGIEGRVRKFAHIITGGLGHLGVPLGIVGMAHAVHNTLKELGEIAHAADDIGLNTDQFQAMQYAAHASRMDFNNLVKSIAQLREAQEKAGSDDKLNEMLHNIGINVEQFKSLNPADALALFARAIETSGDESANFNATMEVFSAKLGPKMVSFLHQLAGGFGDIEAKAKEAGAIIDAELIKQADEIDTGLARAWMSLRVSVVNACADIIRGIKDVNEATDVNGDKQKSWLRRIAPHVYDIAYNLGTKEYKQAELLRKPMNGKDMSASGGGVITAQAPERPDPLSRSKEDIEAYNARMDAAEKAAEAMREMDKQAAEEQAKREQTVVELREQIADEQKRGSQEAREATLKALEDELSKVREIIQARQTAIEAMKQQRAQVGARGVISARLEEQQHAKDIEKDDRRYAHRARLLDEKSHRRGLRMSTKDSAELAMIRNVRGENVRAAQELRDAQARAAGFQNAADKVQSDIERNTENSAARLAILNRKLDAALKGR